MNATLHFNFIADQITPIDAKLCILGLVLSGGMALCAMVNRHEQLLYDELR